MRFHQLLIAIGLLAASSASAHAQCGQHDGLDVPGTICAPANAMIRPSNFKQNAVGICWQDCAVIGTASYTATWNSVLPQVFSTPPTVACAWFRARVRIFNASNVLAWDGNVHLSYARTWLESPPGQQIQVWRYLVNGDLRAVIPNALPCGNPACAPAFGNLVRFTGFVDYTSQCGTILGDNAWMLTHACDAIDHAAGFPRAGSFHPNRYFAFVGPSAGFVVGAGSAVESGAFGMESLRRWDATSVPVLCNAEEPVTAPATITPNSLLCMCGSGPANWFEGQMSPVFGFSTVVAPFTGSDPFRSFPVGQWTNPGVYPGVEELRWNCQEAQWIECTGLSRQEYYFGVTTAGGYPAFTLSSSASVPLPLIFVDQSNSVLLPANVATRNQPYRSDHVLNLNF